MRRTLTLAGIVILVLAILVIPLPMWMLDLLLIVKDASGRIHPTDEPA